MLAEAINKLPCDLRDIVLLSYFANMPDIEIAKQHWFKLLDCFRARIRALKRLKAIISTEGIKVKKKLLSDIPFSIIEKAINEDIEAIDYILAHYRNYIIRLSTRVARDENNNEYMYVDDDMRSRLESKLIYSIIKKV